MATHFGIPSFLLEDDNSPAGTAGTGTAGKTVVKWGAGKSRERDDADDHEAKRKRPVAALSWSFEEPRRSLPASSSRGATASTTRAASSDSSGGSESSDSEYSSDSSDSSDSSGASDGPPAAKKPAAKEPAAKPAAAKPAAKPAAAEESAEEEEELLDYTIPTLKLPREETCAFMRKLLDECASMGIPVPQKLDQRVESQEVDCDDLIRFFRALDHCVKKGLHVVCGYKKRHNLPFAEEKKLLGGRKEGPLAIPKMYAFTSTAFVPPGLLPLYKHVMAHTRDGGHVWYSMDSSQERRFLRSMRGEEEEPEHSAQQSEEEKISDLTG
jgi:hypothetical protein